MSNSSFDQGRCESPCKFALDKLASTDRVEAELIKLRYFVGLTIDEAAAILEISPRTARNYWTHARAWLFREIKKGTA